MVPVDLRPMVEVQPFMPLFPTRSYVLARKPHTPKGQSPYRNPMKVERVLGRYTYILSDGQKWSARRLKRYHDPHQQWMGIEVETEVEPPPVVPERQPQEEVRPRPRRVPDPPPEVRPVPRRSTRQTLGEPPVRLGFEDQCQQQ